MSEQIGTTRKDISLWALFQTGLSGCSACGTQCGEQHRTQPHWRQGQIRRATDGLVVLIVSFVATPIFFVHEVYIWAVSRNKWLCSFLQLNNDLFSFFCCRVMERLLLLLSEYGNASLLTLVQKWVMSDPISSFLKVFVIFPFFLKNRFLEDRTLFLQLLDERIKPLGYGRRITLQLFDSFEVGARFLTVLIRFFFPQKPLHEGSNHVRPTVICARQTTGTRNT